MNPKAQQAEKALAAKSPPERILNNDDFLSTGLTTMNLGICGRVFGGITKGHVYRFNGRSSSGKTFICRTLMAEACRKKSFDDYELIYDDVERKALMDTLKFFGQRLVDRLVPPARTKSGNPYYSRTIGDFYGRIRRKLELGKKVIWIEDSLDSLIPDKESKMTDNKAKAHSQELRKLMDPLQSTGSILVLVCQARANMNPTNFFDTDDITAGGRALEHYPTVEVWLKKGATIRRPYKGQKLPIGSLIRAHIKKNHLTGMDRTISFPFYPTYGIDDIGSCVSFLLQYKHWKGVKGGDEDEEESYGDVSGKVIAAPEFDFEGKVETLIERIEQDTKQRELQLLTGKVWKEIDNAITVKRLPRYQ